MNIATKTMSDSAIADVLIKILARFEDDLFDDEKFSLTCAFDLFIQRSRLSEAFRNFKTHSLRSTKCVNK